MRKLCDKTGVDAPYLEQLGSWGSAKRDPRAWSTTHVYFALIPSDHLDLTPGGNAADSRWFTVSGDRVQQEPAFDHAVLLKAEVARLRAKVEYTSLPVFLMSDEFTLTELHHTNEILLSRQLEKKAFRTRLLAAGFARSCAANENWLQSSRAALPVEAPAPPAYVFEAIWVRRAFAGLIPSATASLQEGVESTSRNSKMVFQIIPAYRPAQFHVYYGII